MLDYTARQKIGGFPSESRSLPDAAQLLLARLTSTATPWDSIQLTAKTGSKQRVIRIGYTAWDLQPFAYDCGWAGPPFRWDEERRFLLRC